MIKFVIYGAGTRGLHTALYMGERVAAIIDNNIEKQGNYWNSVPIISYIEYMNSYKALPVIITPKFEEKEIQKRLKKDGIRCTFLFSDSIYDICAFLYQLDPNDIMSMYNKGDCIDIYGFNVISIIVYDILTRKGCNCNLVMPKKSSEMSLAQSISHISLIQENAFPTTKENLILTEPVLENSDWITAYNNCNNLFDLHIQFNRYSYPEIKKFKNLHKGKRCFIVGTGPSLRVDDLDLLFENNELCFSANGIFESFGSTKWRPTYYFLADPLCFLEFGDDILNKIDSKANFISDNVFIPETVRLLDNTYKWHLVPAYMEASDYTYPFSDDVSKAIYGGGTVLCTGCLSFAIYMGFSEIYLLGADCSVNNSAHPHFYSEGDQCTPYILNSERMFIAYRKARDYADTHGIKIYNATRGGKLEVFPRVDFDSLFDK